MKVKIIGAGSIGNHHAKACRTMGWDVVVQDVSTDALLRMKNEIYPQRYGSWDNEIKLYSASREYDLGSVYDIIMIDTPPDVRMKLAIEALKENPKLLHLEKPLCSPSMDGLPEFLRIWKEKFPSCIVTVGYNHAVSKSIEEVVEIIKSGFIGSVITIDVEFREHWEGIFKAHPWLKGPKDSYLGNFHKGGGAGGEHSHALHLWLYLAKVSSFGNISEEVKSNFDMNYLDGIYDRVAAFILKTHNGIGRVVQDVVTKPPRKWARVQGTKGFVEWHSNYYAYGDAVFWYHEELEKGKDLCVHKNRKDDFLYLMRHYDDLLAGRAVYKDSPLHIDLGLEVMSILHGAYYKEPLR